MTDQFAGKRIFEARIIAKPHEQASLISSCANSLSGAGTRPDQSRDGGTAGWHWRWAVALLLAVSVDLASWGALRAQTANAAGEFQFDISSQPLAAALRKYGTTTGLEVFYDGSLAIGRQSTAVKGTLTAALGLKTLLRGTGYVARATEISNTVTIVKATPATALRATFSQYEPYFAALQVRLSETLCDSDKSLPGGEEITFRFRIEPSGTISNAELLGSGASAGWRHEITLKLNGQRIGEPPAGLPEPVTMIVYPPSAGEATGCPASGRRDVGLE